MITVEENNSQNKCLWLGFRAESAPKSPTHCSHLPSVMRRNYSAASLGLVWGPINLNE